jgi:hypothetical protein
VHAVTYLTDPEIDALLGSCDQQEGALRPIN